MLPPRHGSDLSSGMRDGIPVRRSPVLAVHTNGVAPTLACCSGTPSNRATAPNRVAPSWRGPRVLRRLRQRFVNPKPPPCGAYLPRRTDLGATPAMPACDRLNSTQQETHPMRVTTVVHYVLPFLALVGGAMILFVPRLQNYVVAIYLMLVGV